MYRFLFFIDCFVPEIIRAKKPRENYCIFEIVPAYIAVYFYDKVQAHKRSIFYLSFGYKNRHLLCVILIALKIQIIVVFIIIDFY